MTGVQFFMFVLLFPAFALLGHDFYLFFNNAEGQFALSDLGYIWTQYSPESYKWVVQNVEKDTWAVINEILTQTALILALIFAGFFYVILGLLKLFGAWPFHHSSGERSYKNAKVKYARK